MENTLSEDDSIKEVRFVWCSNSFINYNNVKIIM